MDERLVFVLGAGFTRAFCPDMPLLLDDALVEPLQRLASGLPAARAVLDAELRLTGGRSIDVERLMTRLDSGTPYDRLGREQSELRVLLAELTTRFVSRLIEARTNPSAELEQLARFIVEEGITCVTFNYDDVIDEQLYRVRGRNWRQFGQYYWTPDLGYGFPLQSVGEPFDSSAVKIPPPLPLLLKLHGSLNWRVRKGYSAPHPMNALALASAWYSLAWDDVAEYEPLLDPEPLIIPPVMMKHDLRAQPVFRATWSLAHAALTRAKEVIFIGYSLPVTDLAARSLFAEAVPEGIPITIIDLGRGDGARRRIIDHYSMLRPDLRQKSKSTSGNSPFIFGDAKRWVRDFLKVKGRRVHG